MEFEYRLTGVGWAEATISHEGTTATITASYLGDALGDLLRAVIEVMHGRDEAICHWWEEPGEYRWIFRRKNGLVTVRIVDVAREHQELPSLGSILFAAHLPTQALGAAIAEGARRVLAEHGEDGYKEQWHLAEFPRSELTTLEAMIGGEASAVSTPTALGVVVTQMPVSWDVQRNAERILLALDNAEAGDLVLTPEGSLSGYPADGNVDELQKLDEVEVERELRMLRWAAARAGVELWVGALSKSGEVWVNEAVGVSAHGVRKYRKRNLAHLERPLFEAGEELPVFRSSQGALGVQVCREVRFPEQWSTLAAAGAGILLHLNNGTADEGTFDIWRSLLVARAHETQRWVISANASHERQHAPTMIVAPSGSVELELPPAEDLTARFEVDLTQIRDEYLSQRTETTP